MNEYLDRTIFAQVVIIVAVCVGGWMMFVAPKAERLHRLDQVIAEHSSQAEAITQEAVEDIAAEVGRLKMRLATIEVLNELGRDSSLLYEQFMELARKHDVKIHGMQPGRTIEGDDIVQRRRIDITLEAEYVRLAQFLDAIDTLPGFVRTNALALTPRRSEERELVSGSLTCEVFSFDTERLVQSLEGGTDAQP